MSSIIAGTTIPTGFVVKTDNTGTLQIKTGPSSLTALSIDTAQNITVNDASKFKLPGGTNGQVLTTDGSGNLSWVDGGIGNTGVILTKYIFNATANQMIFTGTDSEGKTFAYSIGNLIVTKNGLCTNAYTANNGVALVLASPCAAGDVVMVYAFKRFVLADMVPASTGGTFNGTIQINGGLTYTGSISGNGSGLTNFTSSQITTALGYTPYNITNPNGYITGISSAMVNSALGYTPYNVSNPSGYISGISGSMVSTALGYTPYNASNPSGYITSAALAPYATTASLSTAIPVGVITLWYGATNTIPSGWRLCDGGGGTPDLRDRFVIGSGNTYGVGSTGGSKDATLVSHSHGASSSSSFSGNALGSHSHSLMQSPHQHATSWGEATGGYYGNAGNHRTRQGSGDSDWDNYEYLTSPEYVSITASSTDIGTPSGSVSTSTSISASGSSATNANLPPYYALCYIMKV